MSSKLNLANVQILQEKGATTGLTADAASATGKVGWRRIKLGLIVVTVGLALLTAIPVGRLYFWVAVVTGQPPGSVPSVGLRTMALESEFSVPLEMTYADLARLVNGVVPPTFDQEFPLRLSGFEHEGVSLHVERGTIVPSPASDKLTFTIPVSGTARFHGVLHPGWKHFHVGPRKSVSETMAFTGHIDGSVTLQVNPNWTLSVKPVLALKLDKAEATILHFGHVSMRKEGQELFDRVAPEWLKRSTDTAFAKLQVPEHAASAWGTLQKPIKASDEPPVWIVVRPSVVHIANVSFKDPTRLHLGIAVSGTVYSTISAAPPAAPPASALPPPDGVASASDRYQLVLPVACSLDALKTQISKVLDNRTIKADGTELRVSGVTVQGSGNRVVIGFDFTARNLWRLKAAKGRIFASAAIGYDARSGTLGIQDLRYDLQTQNKLLALGEWIARPQILEAVVRDVRVNVGPMLGAARDQANARLVNLRSPSGVHLGLSVSRLELDDFRMENGVGYLLLRAQGHSLISVTSK